MAETVDELTWDYEEDGRLVRETLEKAVLSKGAWCTVMYKFRELDRKSDEWRAAKASIVRYQKSQGVYRKKSSFNISSEKQAMAIVETLVDWFGEDADEESAETEESSEE
jgi:hypothetical protein